MSGHSKWANIKHRKARADAARGNVFSKLSKEIIAAARQGGGNPDTNHRLRLAVQKAKDANIPQENITRAIQRGTGELEGVSYEEMVYEGYGPGGVAVLLEILTDNKNRTAAEIRYVFSKNGGNLGESGCVAWMFKRKGSLRVQREGTSMDEDEAMMLALDAGAEDMEAEDDAFTMYTAPEDLESVRAFLEGKGVKVKDAELVMVPQSTVTVSGREAEQLMRLMDSLEEHDDVQRVYSNFDMSDEEMEAHIG